MQSLLLIITTFILSFISLQSFVLTTNKRMISIYPNHSYKTMIYNQEPPQKLQEDNDFKRWSNPLYEEVKINKLWNEREPLLTIGTVGVTKNHINSLYNLIQQHEVVRVKLSHDKLDAHKISQEFITSEQLQNQIELIDIRKRGIMVKRNKK